MVVGVVKLNLFFHTPNSLKAKRQVLNALMQKIEAKFKRVSLAEVDGHDLWQTSTIGITIVGKDQKFVNRKINLILDFIQKNGELEIINAEVEFLSY